MYGYISWPGVYSFKEELGLFLKYCKAQIDEVMKKIENKELRNEIVAAINELPDKCKLIFKLSYLQEMKNKTIAEMMGCSQRTVEAHVYKALKILRNKLDNLYVLLAIFSYHFCPCGVLIISLK